VEIFGTSPFLAEILIRNPEYVHWLTRQLEHREPIALDDDELGGGQLWRVEALALLDSLKRAKRREMLGIAARQPRGRDTLAQSAALISDPGDALIQRTLDIVTREQLAVDRRPTPPGAFAVIGMGKLGGAELNYSSAVDLIYVYEPDDEDDSASHR